MDESIHELEAELKRLRPRRVAVRLLDGIASDLSEQSGERVCEIRKSWHSTFILSAWRRMGWQMAAFAAAITLTFTMVKLIGTGGKPPSVNESLKVSPVGTQHPVHVGVKVPVAGDGYQPVAAANVLYDLKDEGPVMKDGAISARRVRYRYLDTYTWKDPQSKASLKWSVPRDEIRVIPVSFY